MSAPWQAWQCGYELEELQAITARFADYNSHAAARFTRFDEATAAAGLHDGTLRVWPWGCISWYEAKMAGTYRAYHDTAIGNKQPGDYVVTAFTCDDPPEMVEVLANLGGYRPTWVWIWEECEPMRRVVQAAGYRHMGTKITAAAELRGLYYREPADALFPRQQPEQPAAEQLGIARTSLRIAVDSYALRELAGLEYADHYSTYNARRTWAALSLRGYSPDPAFIVKPAEMSRAWRAKHEQDHFALQDTILRLRLPAIDVLHRQLTALAQPHRIRLMRLAPGGGELRRHSDLTDPDSGIADGRVARFHIPLITNPDVAFTSWDARGRRHEANMAVGECWYLDTRKPHAAINRGPTERIHLVVDVESNAAVRGLLEVPQ